VPTTASPRGWREPRPGPTPCGSLFPLAAGRTPQRRGEGAYGRRSTSAGRGRFSSRSYQVNGRRVRSYVGTGTRPNKPPPLAVEGHRRPRWSGGPNRSSRLVRRQQRRFAVAAGPVLPAARAIPARLLPQPVLQPASSTLPLGSWGALDWPGKKRRTAPGVPQPVGESGCSRADQGCQRLATPPPLTARPDREREEPRRITAMLPTSFQCRPDHPFRPPAWRWLRATQRADQDDAAGRQGDDRLGAPRRPLPPRPPPLPGRGRPPAPGRPAARSGRRPPTARTVQLVPQVGSGSPSPGRPDRRPDRRLVWSDSGGRHRLPRLVLPGAGPPGGQQLHLAHGHRPQGPRRPDRGRRGRDPQTVWLLRRPGCDGGVGPLLSPPGPAGSPDWYAEPDRAPEAAPLAGHQGGPRRPHPARGCQDLGHQAGLERPAAPPSAATVAA
jgi:hypothetical protein